MKWKRVWHTTALCLPLAFSGCENRELSMDDFCPDAGYPVLRVVFHRETDDLPPQYMTVMWYNDRGQAIIEEYDSRKIGIETRLPPAIYNPLCVGVSSFENGTLDFAGTASRKSFEAYNPSGTATWYTDSRYGIPTLSVDETIVSESNPYRFYTDGADHVTDTRSLSEGDTVTIDFYPKNVLHEFTFLIHGVKGVTHVEKNRSDNRRGAVSGQAASFFPESNRRGEVPSTVIFTRIEAQTNGQKYSWSEAQKALFTRFDPNWENPETGWTDDWVTGKFSTFGPAGFDDGRFRLVIGMVNKGGYFYKGMWGYGAVPATAVDEVRRQLQGAWGTSGLWETQQAWREQNGGFDIILAGDGGLVIPDDGLNNPTGNGGFIVDTDDWETINVL